MIKALNYLWENYHEVPTDFDQLISVEGIGQYIAGATVCFSKNEPVVLVDTNTVRVVGRVFGLDLSGEARRRKSVIATISETCHPERPRDYYYALIDFAHTVCTPRNPDCMNCPLLDIPCSFGKSRVIQLKEN
jgi:A/G-specific adenine glycosylase